MHVGFEVIAAGSVLQEGQGGPSGYMEGLVPELLRDPRVERLTVYTARWYEPATRWSHPKLTVRRLPVPQARPGRVTYEQLTLPRYRQPNVLALHAVQHFLLHDDIGRARSAYVRYAAPRSARPGGGRHRDAPQGCDPSVRPRPRADRQRANGAFALGARADRLTASRGGAVPDSGVVIKPGVNIKYP